MLLTSRFSTLLTSTFAASNNKQRQEAEAQLRFQFKNELFVQTIIEILMKSNSEPLRLSSLNILKEYSYHLIMTHNQQKLSEYTSKITNLFRAQNLQVKILNMLSDNFKFVLTKNPIHNIRIQAIKRMVEQFSKIQQRGYNCSKNQYIYIIMMTRSLIAFPMYDILNQDLFKASFFVLIQANIKMYALIESDILLDVVTICEILSELFIYYFKRADIKENQTIQKFLWSSEINTLITTILNQTLKKINGICVMVPTPSFTCIMKIQANTLQLAEILLRHRLTDVLEDKLNLQLLSITPLLIQSIRKMLAVNMDKLLQNQLNIVTTTKIIRLFETLIRYPSHCTYFETNSSFLEVIIFPLLAIPTSLKQAFSQKPQLFINTYNFIFDSSMVSSEDLSDKLLALQCSVSEFLIMAIQFLDILDQIVQFCLRMLPDNNNFQQKSVCLILLGIISYNVSNKSDLLMPIKAYLQSTLESCSQLGDQNQNILQILNMILLSRYLTPIYNQQFSSKVLTLVLKTLQTNSSEPHRILSLELLAVLIKIQTDVKDSSEQLVGYLINISDESNEAVRVLEVLYELFSQNPHLKQNTSLSFKVIQYFVHKIKNYSMEKSSITKTINKKCWNIINLIIEAYDTSTTFGNQLVSLIQKQVSSLYRLLIQNTQSSIQEDVVNFNIKLLTKTEKVSTFQSQVVLWLPTLVKNNQLNIEFIYEFLMLFIRYGHIIIQNSDQHQKVLFQECVRCSTVLTGKSKESVAIKGIILLQITLLYCSNINSSIWRQAIWAVYKLSNISHIYYTFAKSNLVSFLSLSLVTFPDFQSEQEVDKLLRKILAEAYCFDVDFSSKIYVVSLCWLIRSSAKSPLVRCRDVSKVVECIAQVLCFSMNNKNPQLNEEEEEYYQNVRLIFKNIPVIDEFQLFKSVMFDMKRDNQQLFKETVQKLSHEAKQNLSSLLKTQFVHSELRQIVQVRRKS